MPTECPSLWRALVWQFLHSLEPEEDLFPGGTRRFGPLVNVALRVAHAEFTVRALRRGALQLMATNGANAETLKLFSGHRRDDTLMRYLNWGAQSADRDAMARSAARYLAESA